MYAFHQDKDRYFDIQYRVTKDFIIPFIREKFPDKQFGRVLEIGCAEAGVLKAFLEEGAFCTGIELSSYRIEIAEKNHAQALAEGRIEFINRSIQDIDPDHDLGGRYDLVILKDVIEHIPHQKEFIHQLPSFLNEGGMIYFGFPPWQMPYGGHQQVCKNKWLSKIPYYHILPGIVYKSILKFGGENEQTIKDLMEVKSTGISIERFENALSFSNLDVVHKRHYLTNPIYQYKFDVKPRVQNKLISGLPFIRDFFTTAAYYLVKPRHY